MLYLVYYCIKHHYKTFPSLSLGLLSMIFCKFDIIIHFLSTTSQFSPALLLLAQMQMNFAKLYLTLLFNIYLPQLTFIARNIALSFFVYEYIASFVYIYFFKFSFHNLLIMILYENQLIKVTAPFDYTESV